MWLRKAREALRGNKPDSRIEAPGQVNGTHYTGYIDRVKELKRIGDLDSAENLLLKLVEATEAEAQADRCGVAPWYYEQLAIVYRKQKNLGSELAILERYEHQAKAPGVGPNKLAERLQKVRALIKKGGK